MVVVAHMAVVADSSSCICSGGRHCNSCGRCGARHSGGCSGGICGLALYMYMYMYMYSTCYMYTVFELNIILL